jgi:hypothetical protein
LTAILVALAGCPNPKAAMLPTDRTPPTGLVVINNDDTYTVSTSVTLALDASDNNGSGGIQMMVSHAADFAGSSWESFAATLAWTLIEGDGLKTVFAKFKDAAGNVSAVYSDTIELDASLPGPPEAAPELASEDDTGTSSTDNITRQTSALSFSGSVADATVAGVNLYDSVDSPPRFLGSAPVDAAGQWSLDLDLAEGVYTLVARTVDSAGNESPSSPSLAVTVDMTPPSEVPGLLKPAQGENTGAVQRPLFTWTSAPDADAYELQADDHPGFGSVEYYWTNLSGTSYTPLMDMNSSTAVPVGTRYYLRLRAMDSAGNAGAWSSGAPRYVNVGRFDKDFNGDGYSDLIVGADRHSSYQGRAYIFYYYAGAPMNNTANVSMSGEATGDHFGQSVASAGDVNGDGYADAIVGAYGYDGSRGRAYVFYGGAVMNGSADVIVTGALPGDQLGVSVASAGDVNGDGYADAIVGANGYNSYQGRAYIYYGGAAMDNNADVTVTGEATSNHFGYRLSSAGDVNGDGYADAIVGAFNYNGGWGRAYLYYGGANMNEIADVTITGGAGAALGVSVASAGDVNGDGYADAIVGAHGHGSSMGKAYIYHGGASMNQIADVTMTGEAADDHFGVSVASAGDLNGDGYADAIVGAHSHDAEYGKAYIYFGGSSMNEIADLTQKGAAPNNYFGVSVASAGDVNRDGYADAVVGAHTFNNSVGRAYVFYGGGSMDNIVDSYVTGEAALTNFGISVASAGEQPLSEGEGQPLALSPL